ncbi:hypothetical protein [Streptomyces sp. N35]|uniref:hypothetical protein n=1 Tax=Streptomyces sp. N35 TaxID=2795730 RepID=UPI0018F6872F|nr:hypothetical protein [Streptomyces sp. N35]
MSIHSLRSARGSAFSAMIGAISKASYPRGTVTNDAPLRRRARTAPCSSQAVLDKVVAAQWSVLRKCTTAAQSRVSSA